MQHPVVMANMFEAVLGRRSLHGPSALMPASPLAVSWGYNASFEYPGMKGQTIWRQVDGARPMDEVFANIDGVLSAFVEDHVPAEAAVA